MKNFSEKFHYPRVSSGDQPLTKKPEDSGCEIASSNITHIMQKIFKTSITVKTLPCIYFFTTFCFIFRQGVKGSAEGQLNFQGHNAALEAQLDKLFTALGYLPDISIRIYDTTLPQNRSTTVKDAKRLIEEFPSRLMTINKGQGIPIQVKH